MLPLDDRQIERINPDAGRAAHADQGQHASCCSRAWAGCRRTASSTSRTSRSPSPSELDVPADGAEGVIIAQGGRFGGWSLYAKDGRAKFHYNVLGIKSFDIEATEPDSDRHHPGAHGVRLRRRRHGQGRQRHALLRRQGSRQAAASTKRRASSSRPTRRPTSATSPAPPSARTTPPTPAGSTARSTGCESISARTPRTPTTTSTPTNASGSRWRGSNHLRRYRRLAA